LQDNFDKLFGPGLAVLDFSLGILYLLAVSSVATYGILMAGWFKNYLFNSFIYSAYLIASLWLYLSFIELDFTLKTFDIQCLVRNEIENIFFIMFFKVKIKIKNIQSLRGNIFKVFYSQSDSVKSLHNLYIKEQRKALGCSHYTFR